MYNSEYRAAYRDSQFSMRALSLLEAAGVSVLRQLSGYEVTLQAMAELSVSEGDYIPSNLCSHGRTQSCHPNVEERSPCFERD